MTVTVANTSNTSTFQYWLNRTNDLADAMTTKAVTVDSNTAVGNATINGYLFSNGIGTSTLQGGNASVVTVLTISSNVLISTGNNLTIGNSTTNTNITSTLISSSTLSLGNSTVNTTVNSSILTLGNSSVNSTLSSTSLNLGNTTTLNTSVISIGNSSVNVSINTSSIYVNGSIILPSYSNTVTLSGISDQIVDSFNLSTNFGGEYVLYVYDNFANSQQISKVLVIHNTSDALISEYGVIYTNNQLGIFSANANSTHVRLLFTPTVTSSTIKFYRTIIN